MRVQIKFQSTSAEILNEKNEVVGSVSMDNYLFICDASGLGEALAKAHAHIKAAWEESKAENKSVS